MVDVWSDIWSDIWGSSGAGPAPVFSTGRPLLVAQVAVNGTAISDPTAGAFIVGRSRLDSVPLTLISWVDLETPLDNVVSVTIDPSNTSELDSVNAGRATVVVENYSGTWDPENPASPYAGGGLEVGMPVRFIAQLDTDTGPVRYGLFRGNVDDIVPDYGKNPTVTFTCTDTLASLGRAKVQAPGTAGDTTGVRLGHIYDAAQVPTTLRAFDRGLSTCIAVTDTDWALTLAQQVVETELGELWVDGDGVNRFYDRTRIYLATRSTTVQATFSDSSTDIDMTGMTAGRRRAEVFNEARITRQADDAVEQVAEDAASKALFGPQTFPSAAGTLLRTDQEAFSLAAYIVARWANPRTRFSAIEVDASVQGMWDVLMPLRRFDRIRAVRDYGPVTIDRELLIEGIGHSITADTWAMAISTRDVDTFRPFVVGTTRIGGGVLV